MLAMIQFASAGILALFCAIVFEPFPTFVSSEDIWGLVFLTLICTAGCILLQVFGQKYTLPSETAIIISLESPFGALSSVLLYGEVLTVKLLTGFVLTFAAVIISETKLNFLNKSKALEQK